MTGQGGPGRAERALDDALYYLRRGCEPCAQRHFDRALRHGATAEQIDAIRAAAGAAGAAGAAAADASGAASHAAGVANGATVVGSADDR